jgi:NhaA family Na+:H+ antiporter
MPNERRPMRTLPLIVRPLQEFLATETAGGALLLAATAAALLWANAPFGGTYADVWGAHLSLNLRAVTFDESLVSWVNDGLMAIFFFVVGLEIKREVSVGELSSLRGALLPILAALGGMIVPAAVYLALNAGGAGEAGWGVPMATDIAFALGVLALLGSRVPNGLKVFLAALAIADDIGAILVVAFFYTGEVYWGWLALALVPGLAIVVFLVLYPIGLAIWTSIGLSNGSFTLRHYAIFFPEPESYRALLSELQGMPKDWE